MIEAAREILEMIKHMPEYTLWVLCGILFYKVFIIGSWIAVARLVIVKLHDFLVRERVEKLQFEMGGLRFWSHERDKAIGIFSEVYSHRHKDDKYLPAYSNFTDSDIGWLRNAVSVQIQKDNDDKRAKESSKHA